MIKKTILLFLSIILLISSSCSKNTSSANSDKQKPETMAVQTQPDAPVIENFFVVGPLWMQLELTDPDKMQKLKPLMFLSSTSPELSKSNPLFVNLSQLNKEQNAFEEAEKEVNDSTTITKVCLNSAQKLTEKQIQKVLEFKNTKELYVNVETFQQIKGFIPNFNNLQKISILGNSTSTLTLEQSDIDLFINIPHLSFEYINQLTMPKNFKLPTLQSISFEGTNIKNNDWSFFKDLNHISKLNMGFSSFQNLALLSQFKNLEELNLSNSKISNDELRGMPAFPNLKSLNLSCGLVITSSAKKEEPNSSAILNFSNFPSLKVLFLEGRNFTEENLLGINQCKNLERLVHDKISLSPDLLQEFSYMHKLRELSDLKIENFVLSNRAKAFFKRLATADEISLAKTNFTSKDWNDFKCLSFAKTIDISNCPITSIPDLQSFSNLEILSINNCSFEGSVTISNPKLQILSFSDNKLESLTLNTPKLKYLPSFDSNIPISSSSQLKEISSFEHRKKVFSKRDQDFINMLPNLKSLLFYHSTFESIPQFKNVKHLRSLQINTGGKKLPAKIFHAIKNELPNLQSLKLTSCRINDFYLKTISEYKELKHLDLGWNEINGSRLHFLSELKNLESLSLTLNRNIQWDKELEKLCKSTKLHTVYLDGTPVTRAGLNTLLNTKQLSSITISDKFKKFIPLKDLKRFKFSIF